MSPGRAMFTQKMFVDRAVVLELRFVLIDREGFARLVRLFRVVGLSKGKIGEFFNGAPTTINIRRKRVKPFVLAWNEGGEIADSEVAGTVRKRAVRVQISAVKLSFDSKLGAP